MAIRTDPRQVSNHLMPLRHRMPFRLSVGRTVGAALFTASLLLTSMPGPSLALDPPRPLPGYRPAFVTERQSGPWVDCAWASAAMLLDKWTNGVTIVDRKRLRLLARDPIGGSNFADMQRAFARLGLKLSWSPSGGDRITWPRLLDRLSHGSGAILFGDDGKLPRKYGRWDPSLWRNTGILDDHALYLDAYDRKTKRILVMDPLAPAGWGGEWIPVSALKQFAWHAGSVLWAATTPTAAKAPFAGVELGEPGASADATALHLRWPIEGAPAAWKAPAFSAAAQIEPVAEPDPLAVDIAALPADEAVPPLNAGVTGGDAEGLEAAIPLPATPGIYRVTVTLTDQRFGREVATAGPFNLYVPGPRAWRVELTGPQEVAPGEQVRVSFSVSNVGTESWAPPSSEPGSPQAGELPRNTRLVGTWVGPNADLPGDRGSATLPDVQFGPLLLPAGAVQLVDQLIRMPPEVGEWHLLLRVVESHDGPSAFLGSAPGDMTFDILDPAAGVAVPGSPSS
jgi:hypothetical protein